MTDPRYRRNPHALVRHLPDGLLVLGPAAAEPIIVTGPGSALWSLLDEPRTLDDLVVALAAEFATDADTVRHDLARAWVRLLDTRAVVAAP
jgi:hypothetical protein